MRLVYYENQGMRLVPKDRGNTPMIESAVTSRGRTTLPKAVRKALGVVPGNRVRYVILDDNQVRMLPVRPLARLFGAYEHEGPPVTLHDMERAISDGANDR